MRVMTYVLAVAIAVLAAGALGAQQLPTPGQGGTARQIGMGGAQVAVANDGYAAASNPAGLARLRAYWTQEDQGRRELFGGPRGGNDSELSFAGGVRGGLPQASIGFAGGGDNDDKGYGVTADVLGGGGGVAGTFMWTGAYGAGLGNADELSWGAAIDGTHQTGVNVLGGRIGLLWTSEGGPGRPDGGIAVGLTGGYDSRRIMTVRGGAAAYFGDSSVVAADLTYIQGRAAMGWNVGTEIGIGQDWFVRLGSNNAYGTGTPSLAVGIGYGGLDEDWRADVAYEYRAGQGLTLLLGGGVQF